MVNDRKVELLLKKIVRQLQSKYKPDRVILYGSYAYGKPTEDSDIDLLIIKDTDKRRVDRYVEVKKIVYEPGRRVPVEPLV